jgi:hypothetical protein
MAPGHGNSAGDQHRYAGGQGDAKTPISCTHHERETHRAPTRDLDVEHMPACKLGVLATRSTWRIELDAGWVTVVGSGVGGGQADLQGHSGWVR